MRSEYIKPEYPRGANADAGVDTGRSCGGTPLEPAGKSARATRREREVFDSDWPGMGGEIASLAPHFKTRQLQFLKTSVSAIDPTMNYPARPRLRHSGLRSSSLAAIMANNSLLPDLRALVHHWKDSVNWPNWQV